MNKKTLQKVIDELNKDTPRLDYVRGILETLMETEEVSPLGINQYSVPQINMPLQTGPVTSNISAAEQAALLAEQGFVKGTKPGVVTETSVILK